MNHDRSTSDAPMLPTSEQVVGRDSTDALLHELPVGVFYVDAAGSCEYVDERWLSITGIPEYAALGQSWLQAIHPEDLPHVRVQWHSATQDAGELCAHFRILRPDGNEMPVLARMKPCASQTPASSTGYVGILSQLPAQTEPNAVSQNSQIDLERLVRERTLELTAANGILKDQIAERRRATEALRESEALWRSLVQDSPDFILKTDPTGVVKFVNRTHPGVTEQEIIGASLFDYVDGDYEKLLREAFFRAMSTGQPMTASPLFSKGPPDETWYSTRVSPIQREGQVVGAVCVATDITAQKKADDLAKRKQDELEHVSRVASVGAMASEMAHELNQPLAAVTNYVSGCIRRLKADQISTEQLIETLEEAVTQSHRASDILRRQSDFVRKRKSARVPIDVDALVADSIALAAPQLKARHVIVHRELQSEHAQMAGDPLRMQQLLINLLINGVEAMVDTPQASRQLTVTTRIAERDTILISVQDAGCGLDADLQDKLFEPFYTTKPNGVGMGLSICRSIADSHGGRLWATSNAPLPGTTFHFALPRYLAGSPE